MSKCGPGRRVSMVLAALAAAVFAQPALAQSWRTYSFPEAGFAVQFTAPPTVSEGVFKTVGGVSVPTTVYALRKPGAVFSVTVADFSGNAIEPQPAIEAAVRSWSEAGEVKLDLIARIDREFGRQLSVANADGSRSIVSIFFVGRRLYSLEARGPGETSAEAVRFQQSLELIGLGAEAFRPENRSPEQAGPGGPNSRRPPPLAFAACAGKPAGAAVEFIAARGAVEAVCIQTAQGMVARPDMPPPGFGPNPR